LARWTTADSRDVRRSACRYGRVIANDIAFGA
jgi:hypothetical protein